MQGDRAQVSVSTKLERIAKLAKQMPSAVLTTLSHHVKEYYFLFDEFFPDEVNALREFALAYPIELDFDAAILSHAQRPVQLFGRMRRVPFTPHARD